VSGRERRDHGKDLLGGLAGVDVASHHLHPAHHGVDMGILEAGDEQSPASVDHLGEWAT
jgi:hypothetical protein